MIWLSLRSNLSPRFALHQIFQRHMNGKFPELFLHKKCTYIKNAIFVGGNWANFYLSTRQGFQKIILNFPKFFAAIFHLSFLTSLLHLLHLPFQRKNDRILSSSKNSDETTQNRNRKHNCNDTHGTMSQHPTESIQINVLLASRNYR